METMDWNKSIGLALLAVREDPERPKLFPMVLVVPMIRDSVLAGLRGEVTVYTALRVLISAFSPGSTRITHT
jgi:hypothetical protein